MFLNRGQQIDRSHNCEGIPGWQLLFRPANALSQCRPPWSDPSAPMGTFVQVGFDNLAATHRQGDADPPRR